MDFDELVEPLVAPELRQQPAVRFFKERILRPLWERAKIRAGIQAPRLTGVPFLRRVVKRHLGEQAARGITVRTGIMALAASFIDQELYEIYPPPPGGEGEEALQLQDEWLTEGKFLA